MTLVCMSVFVIRNRFINPILGVRLKLHPFINPICGQMGRPSLDISKKVRHMYVSLVIFEMVLLTLFTGMGLK